MCFWVAESKREWWTKRRQTHCWARNYNELSGWLSGLLTIHGELGHCFSKDYIWIWMENKLFSYVFRDLLFFFLGERSSLTNKPIQVTRCVLLLLPLDLLQRGSLHVPRMYVWIFSGYSGFLCECLFVLCGLCVLLWWISKPNWGVHAPLIAQWKLEKGPTTSPLTTAARCWKKKHKKLTLWFFSIPASWKINTFSWWLE